MSLISSIRAALGLADPKAAEPTVSPRETLTPRRPIPHLPPPPAPKSAEQNHDTAPEAPSAPIGIRAFPGLQETIGPLPLNKEAISNAVNPGIPGHFLIGSQQEGGGVIPELIGRSADDLSAELERCIGKASHFLAHEDANAREAFFGECLLYHNIGSQFGMTHPMRSHEERWGCPKCGIFNPGP